MRHDKVGQYFENFAVYFEGKYRGTGGAMQSVPIWGGLVGLLDRIELGD